MAINIRGTATLLQVFDMPTSIRFYRDLLGFELASQSQPELKDDCDWALVKLNDVELMLNTAYERQDRPVSPDPLRISNHADTSIYLGCPDVDATYSYLISKDLDVKEPAITKYNFRALYVFDPDGYSLVFHWPAE